MGKPNTFLLILCAALASFIVGKWTGSTTIVKADSPDSPQIQVRPVSGDSSLIVYYPKMNQFFVYQNPFVGLTELGLRIFHPAKHSGWERPTAAM